MEYYGNEGDPDGAPEWGSEWLPTDRLPLGVLVTITVLDSRTAIKVADIKDDVALTEEEINSIFESTPPADGVETLLRQGAVTMSRFIPLNRN